MSASSRVYWALPLLAASMGLVTWDAEESSQAADEPVRPAASGAKGADAADPFAAPADLGATRAPTAGETSLVGVTVEIDGKVAIGTEGLVFHADDRRAYVGVSGSVGKVRGVSLLAPAKPRYRFIVPSAGEAKTVDAEFVAWKNFGSTLVLAAPRNEVPAPYPLNSKPKSAAEQPIRFSALRMTRSDGEITFARTLHSGRIVHVSDEIPGRQPEQLVVSVEIPAIIGTEMPLGIVAAPDGTPLGRAFQAGTTSEGRTQYLCLRRNSLLRLRAPEVDGQVSVKVDNTSRRVSIDCSLTAFDPLGRIKTIKARCKLSPMPKKKPPADFKLEYTTTMQPGKRTERRPQNEFAQLPEVEMIEWKGRLEFDNYRVRGWVGDETAYFSLTWIYEDVDGEIYELCYPSSGIL